MRTIQSLGPIYIFEIEDLLTFEKWRPVPLSGG